MTRLRNVLTATTKGLLSNASVRPATLAAYCMSLLQDAQRAITSARVEAKHIAATTDIWTTSTVGPRSTSDGRGSLMVEREQKLTGSDLHEDRRQKVNKASEEEMLGFALQLLNGAVERKLLQPTEPSHRQLVESFIDSLLFVLRTCRKASVVRDCLRFLDAILQWKIDTMTQNVEPLRRSVFLQGLIARTPFRSSLRLLRHVFGAFSLSFPLPRADLPALSVRFLRFPNF